MIPSARLVRSHRLDHTSVLVLGGTAVQRLQVAYTFHRESRLRSGPLVCFDCSREERELRGALETWLSLRTPETQGGALHAADSGTLFLDDIGSLTRDTQRLLVAFTRRVASPLLGEERCWSGRLAAGNWRSLRESVAAGEFAADLLDALDKVRIELPETSASRPSDREPVEISSCRDRWCPRIGHP